MVKYVQISAKYSDFFKAMGIPALSQGQKDSQTFQNKLERDKHRTNIVEFRPNQYSVTQNKLFDPNDYESRQSFTQGDNEASVIIAPFQGPLHHYSSSLQSQVLRLAYMDDENTPCGLTIYEMGLRPNSHYVICVIRNTTAAPEERELWMCCDEETLDYTPLRDSTEVTPQAIEGSQRFEVLRDQLNSENIRKLINPLFEGDKISTDEFDRLASRLIPDRNIDSRMDRELIFKEYLDLLKAIDHDKANDLLKLSQTDINFYEESNMDGLFNDLFEKVSDSESKKSVFNLYLEFKKTTGIHYDHIQYLETIKSENIQLGNKSLSELYNDLFEKIYQPDLRNRMGQFLKEINACRDPEFKEAVQGIYDLINRTPLDHLPSLNIRLEFINHWINFVKNPTSENYRKYVSWLERQMPFDPQKMRSLGEIEHAKRTIEQLKVSLGSQQEETFLFDPQGRILVPMEKLMVSFDISHDQTFQGAYNERLKKELEQSLGQTTDQSEIIIQKLNKLPSKSCIIPLQHELYFHLLLASRVYRKFEGIDDHDVQEAHQRAMPEVNALIMKAFAKGLIAATTKGELDVEALNKHLDEARDRITEKGHTLLLHHLRTIKKADILMPPLRVRKEDLKHAAATTTASDDSLLYLDNHLGLATFIEGSAVTSHDRQEGVTHLAHRSLGVFRLNEQGDIVDKIPRTRVRTSSLPVKVGLTEQKYIDDVKTKLTHLADTYQFRGAFTYNLFTALHDTGDELSDLRKKPHDQNRQTQSARHILLGAHAYNREMSQRYPKGAYCFVQGVSVSGFGEALGYRRVGLRTALTNENTLMSELSLVRVIDKAAGDELQEKYESFLKPRPVSWIGRMMGYRDPYYSTYFFRTQAGKEARRIISENKEVWKRSFHKDHSDSSKRLVMGGLKKIMAFDLHFSHQYAKTLEALSLYLEDQSIFGCKSGNERTPIVYQRSELLDQKNLPESIKTALTTLNQATTKAAAVKAAKALRLAINQEYNTMNVYGAATMIPLLDQSAGHKIKIKKGHDIDRNRAEDAGITHLQQKHVAKMQAHKDLVGYMLAALSKPFELKAGQKVASDVDDGVETSKPKQGPDSTIVINGRLSRSSGTKSRYSRSLSTIPESDEEDEEEHKEDEENQIGEQDVETQSQSHSITPR